MFTDKKREGIDTAFCDVSLAETPKASIKDQDPPLPITPFGTDCCVRFCWTTFLETAVYELK